MPKCCICGRDASILAQGKWWCEKHYRYVRKGPEPSSEGKRGLGGSENRGAQDPPELDLEWL